MHHLVSNSIPIVYPTKYPLHTHNMYIYILYIYAYQNMCLYICIQYIYIYIYIHTSIGYTPIIEGSLEVKLPTGQMKSRDGKSQRREEKRRRKKIKKRKSPKKEDPGARKGRKVAKHFVFPMICGSGGSKSRLAKAVGAEPCGQMRDEKLHAVPKLRKSRRITSFWMLLSWKIEEVSQNSYVSKLADR